MAQVVAGAEAWSAAGTSGLGVLLVHGFTGNPVSLRPLAEAMAAEGHGVELPRLPGHGTRWQDLQRTTWQDWVREAAGALAALRADGGSVVIAGLSMGAAIALHLAARHAEDVAGIVAINPFLRARDPRLRFLGVVKRVVPAIPGVGNDIAKAGGDEHPYPRVPLRALASVVEFQHRVRSELPAVRAPLLLLTSRQDHVVDPADSELVAGAVAGPVRRMWLERSYHVATLDHDADLIASETAAFVQAATA